MPGASQHRRYCSAECKEIAQAYRRAHRHPDAHPDRDRDDWGCVACGKPLEDKQRSTKRFCSASCRNKFWHAMKRTRSTLTP